VFRVGGLVKDGSLQRSGTDVRFVVTDTTDVARGGLLRACCPICLRKDVAWSRKASSMARAGFSASASAPGQA
jgi:hypothetical protein